MLNKYTQECPPQNVYCRHKGRVLAIIITVVGRKGERSDDLRDQVEKTITSRELVQQINAVMRNLSTDLL